MSRDCNNVSMVCLIRVVDSDQNYFIYNKEMEFNNCRVRAQLKFHKVEFNSLKFCLKDFLGLSLMPIFNNQKVSIVPVFTCIYAS